MCGIVVTIKLRALAVEMDKTTTEQSDSEALNAALHLNLC